MYSALVRSLGKIVSSMHGYGQHNTYNNSMSVISMTGNVRACRKVPINHSIIDVACEVNIDHKPAFRIVCRSVFYLLTQQFGGGNDERLLHRPQICFQSPDNGKAIQFI